MSEVRVVLPLTELTERDTRRALRACDVLYLDMGAGYMVVFILGKIHQAINLESVYFLDCMLYFNDNF